MGSVMRVRFRGQRRTAFSVVALGLVVFPCTSVFAEQPSEAEQDRQRQEAIYEIVRSYRGKKLSEADAAQKLTPLVRELVRDRVKRGQLDQMIAEVEQALSETQQFRSNSEPLVQARIRSLLDDTKKPKRLEEASLVETGLARLQANDPKAFSKNRQELERRLAVYGIVRAYHERKITRTKAERDLERLIRADVQDLVASEGLGRHAEVLEQERAKLLRFKDNPELMVQDEIQELLKWPRIPAQKVPSVEGGN